MNYFAKVIVTVGVVFVFIILFAFVVSVGEPSNGGTPGILGLILMGAVIGAVRAIWKKDKKSDDTHDDNTSILQK